MNAERLCATVRPEDEEDIYKYLPQEKKNKKNNAVTKKEKHKMDREKKELVGKQE